MSTPTATRIDLDSTRWPAAEDIAPGRVLTGRPSASTLILEDVNGRQLGLWRVTPGEFVTDHTGYLEYIHIISGSGTLIADDGHVTGLEPGVTVLMQPGWKGRWVVDQTITKVFTVVNS